MSSDLYERDENPIDVASYAWPAAELDPVAKLRALAAGLPGAAVDETLFDVPFERFWPFIEDLEGNTARYEGTVTGLRILDRNGENLHLEARSPIGTWTPFDCVLRSGWCLMNSKHGKVGMAAHPENATQTRFIHFEASASLGRLTRPFFAWNIRGDFRRLRRIFASAK